MDAVEPDLDRIPSTRSRTCRSASDGSNCLTCSGNPGATASESSKAAVCQHIDLIRSPDPSRSQDTETLRIVLQTLECRAFGIGQVWQRDDFRSRDSAELGLKDSHFLPLWRTQFRRGHAKTCGRRTRDWTNLLARFGCLGQAGLDPFLTSASVRQLALQHLQLARASEE